MRETVSAVIKPSLQELFNTAWTRGRVLLFSAPCGSGKTTTARALLAPFRCHWLNGQTLSFSDLQPDNLPDKCDAVAVDDLQYLVDSERQQAICGLIRTRTDLRFVLLGRSPLPGWLMPFQFAGLLHVARTTDLHFDLATTQALLAAREVKADPVEMSAIMRDFKGYPLALDLLCHRLNKAGVYGPEVLTAVMRDLYLYYDEMVFRRFSQPLRTLLVSLAPFERFTLEMARMVSGDPQAGDLLGFMQRDTSMLVFDGLNTYHFWPIFRKFLVWEMQQLLREKEQRALFSRAGLHHELHDNLDKALDCYAQAGEREKISALLIKNAEQHPGIGQYQQLERHYFALSEEEIWKSPSLICGMSMLTALCMDYDASERWYAALQTFAAGLKKTDADYRDIQGKLAYLDIALPQRGSKGLVEVISHVFRVMTDKQLRVPEFSVTSNLPSVMNGGKDFCDWSKKDDLLYATMKKALETVLGKSGIGLPDAAICESKFEKGEDVSKRLLTLMSRLGDIQAHGTPDMAFAVVGLLARVQVAQGKADAALDALESLRERFVTTGETRFLPNLDALRCRIWLRQDRQEAVHTWLQESAPKNDARLWSLWRYQYLTRATAQIAEGAYDDALLLLARLGPYCERCHRVMDGIHVHLLTALCQHRLGDPDWKQTLHAALDTCHAYDFVWPVAQYGAAILPLLGTCDWKGDAAYLDKLVLAARAQAIEYPRFLKARTAQLELLSAAETQVLKLVCENLSNQEIGEILGIKLPTVKTHVSRVLQKLGVNRRSEAKAAAEALRLL